MFPKIGHGRTRGMFATLDIEPAELRLARFIDPCLPPPSLPPPMQCARHEPLSHAAEARIGAEQGRALGMLPALAAPYAGLTFEGVYGTVSKKLLRSNYADLEARVIAHMLDSMEEGKPYRISRTHDEITLEPEARN